MWNGYKWGEDKVLYDYVKIIIKFGIRLFELG